MAEICKFDDGAHRSMMRRSFNDVGKKPEIKRGIKGRGGEIAEKWAQGRDKERIEICRAVSSPCSTKSLPLISRSGLLSKLPTSFYKNYRDQRTVNRNRAKESWMKKVFRNVKIEDKILPILFKRFRTRR